MTLQIGDKAPDFTLLTDTEDKVSLKDFRGSKVLLYFYPKDNTPGCTQESCDFRDNYATLQKKGVEVFGISKDSVKSHIKFKEKYDLPFPLLADEDTKVCTKYDVMKEKSMFGKTYMGIVRSTFLIDEKGKIEQIWRKVKVKGHVEQVLDELN